MKVITDLMRRCLVLLLVGALAGCSPRGAAPTATGQDEQTTIAAALQATLAAQTVPSPREPQTAAPTSARPEAAPSIAGASTAAPAAITPVVFLPDDAPAAATAEGTPVASPGAEASGDGSATAPFTPALGENGPVVNIALVFDASGSMAQAIPGSNETRIEAARRAMEQVIAQLPADGANLNVGFRVYGHRGDNSEAGRAVSCQSTELLVQIDGVDKARLLEQTNAFEPTGWTPITLALTAAGTDLQAGENVRNLIILVTDGEETCEGDPCAVSEALARSEAEVRIDVVGFGQDSTLQDKLQCIADNSGGLFTDAQDGDALVGALETLIDGALRRSYLRIIALGPDGQQLIQGNDWNGAVTITELVGDQGQSPPVDRLALEREGIRTPLEGEGEQLIELPPGTYSFTVRQRLGFYGGEDDRLPQANGAVTYVAEIAEGRTTTAVVGVGGLTLRNTTGDEADACTLRLEVLVDGTWQTAYPEATESCSNAEGNAPDIQFEQLYPLLPGTYRVLDTRFAHRVVSDEVTLRAGQTLTIDPNTTPNQLRVIAVGPDGQQLVRGSEWNGVVTITELVDAEGRPAPVEEGALANDRTRTALEGEGEQLFELPPGRYRFTVRQRLSFRGGLTGALPEANDVITYTAEIAERRTTTAVVGVGAIRLVNGGVEDDVTCGLRLEVALDGRWQVVHREAVQPPCSSDDGRRADLEFERDYPLLPGRYRLIDPARGRVIAGEILLEVGKRVSVNVTDG
jgi:Mg-chelatase subunit ChlD